MMSSIAYTDENYFVKYGTDSKELDMENHQWNSIGANIAMNYTVKLSDLQPCVTYYYSIVARNDVGSTASRVSMFTTRESEYSFCLIVSFDALKPLPYVSSMYESSLFAVLMIESSGQAQLGEPHILTCAIECGSANYTSLAWEDSDGHILEVADGTESRLELHFPTLSSSNVSNYTCKVSYDNGDYTERTEELVAKGKNSSSMHTSTILYHIILFNSATSKHQHRNYGEPKCHLSWS